MIPAERTILLPWRALMSCLFSFEALLILFMFAGLYNGDPRFAWVPKSLLRLQNMVVDGELRATAATRASDYENVFEYWPDVPLFGHGAGSWPILEIGRESVTGGSPHNLFLEAAVECGMVGVVVMLAVFLVGLRPISFDRLQGDPLALCAFVLFVHEFLDAQLGGDVAQRRIMFMLLGVLTVFTVRNDPLRPAAPAAAPASAALAPATLLDLSMSRWIARWRDS